MKSIHTVVNVLKELDDFDGVLAHVLGCLHPMELLQATLDLPQLWHQPHLRNKRPLSDDWQETLDSTHSLLCFPGSWLLPATWQSCGGSAVTLWLQGSWPTRWSGRPAADTPSLESTARGIYYQSIILYLFIMNFVCSESVSTDRKRQQVPIHTHSNKIIKKIKKQRPESEPCKCSWTITSTVFF